MQARESPLLDELIRVVNKIQYYNGMRPRPLMKIKQLCEEMEKLVERIQREEPSIANVARNIYDINMPLCKEIP